MKITIFSEKPDDMRDFDKKEWKQYDVEHFGRELAWDTKMCFLKAEDESGIIGTMELKIEGGVGKVNTLLVANTNQRRGVGRALMQKAEEITRDQKGHKMFVVTGKGWEAVKFYETLGYKKTGDLPNHYFNVDFIELSKFL